MATAFPILYALGSAGLIWFWSSNPGRDVAGPLILGLAVLKWGTVAGLFTLGVWCGAAIGHRPERWRRAGIVWSVTAVALVGAYASVHETVESATNTSSMFRLWPTDIPAGSTEPAHTIFAAWDAWSSVTTVLGREIAFLIAAAWITARMARLFRGFALPIAGFALPIVYVALQPWSLVLDFDFFIGDAITGGAIGELWFFIGPFDQAGAIALSVAGVVTAGLLASWGRETGPL